MRSKLQKILDVIFRSEDDGGLGITYDNSRTRTVSEVLKDRKANCILTALMWPRSGIRPTLNR